MEQRDQKLKEKTLQLTMRKTQSQPGSRYASRPGTATSSRHHRQPGDDFLSRLTEDVERRRREMEDRHKDMVLDELATLQPIDQHT
eukprot:gene4515-14676_t